MLSTYFKLAFRNLRRNKAFSFINLAGLAVGMACTMLILLWVWSERSWDRFHSGYDQIHQVLIHRDFNGEISTGRDLMYPLEGAMKQQLPQVQYATNATWGGEELYSVGEKRLRQRTYTVGADFLRVFDFPFLAGDAAALGKTEGVVLTERAARALFGSADVVGKTLKVNNEREAVVSAVLKDLPASSTLQFDALLPFNPSEPWIQEARTDWVNSGLQLFVRLREGSQPEGLARQVIQIIRSNTASDNPNTRGSVVLHPMAKWRLYETFEGGQNTGGRIEYVRLFTWIALVILLIACVNFMNLSTARSEKRAREVGIRKTLGSPRSQLLQQFLAESVVMALLSFFLAFGLVLLVLPHFSSLLEQPVTIPYDQPVVWIAALGITALTGLLAGSYPAFYLSSFSPVRVLKGLFRPGSGAVLPRKVLVTGQFIVSIVLISASFIIYQQLQHVKQRQLGYDPNDLIMVTASPELNRQYTALRQELLGSGLVAAVNRTSGELTQIYNYTPAPDWTGKPAGQELIVASMRTDADLVPTTGIKLLAGREFREHDTSSILLNKAAVAAMGLKEPVGMQVTWAGQPYTIVGVLDDMVMNSPYEPVSPMMYLYGWGGTINLRLKPGVDVSAALSRLEGIIKRFNPEFPFEYEFTDAAFGAKFVREELLGRFALLFSGLAIFICCLGLFGLVSFSIERRTKEIGIRKVLGASLQSLLLLISKEFLLLVAVAFLVAIPAAWWFLSSWLENFSYRTEIHPWYFGIVGLLTLVIAAFTICLNASRTALRNPVKSLRSE